MKKNQSKIKDTFQALYHDSKFPLLGFFVCLVFSINSPSYANMQKYKKDRLIEGTKRYWYNGDRKEYVWMVDDEIAVFHKPQKMKNTMTLSKEQIKASVKEVIPGAIVERTNKALTFYKVPKAEIESIRSLSERIGKIRGVKHSSPVFYPGIRNPDTQMALTGEIIVGFKIQQTIESLAEFGARYGIILIKKFKFSPESALFDARSAIGDDSLDLANRIYESGEVEHAYPNWLKVTPTWIPKKSMEHSTFLKEGQKKNEEAKGSNNTLPSEEPNKTNGEIVSESETKVPIKAVEERREQQSASEVRMPSVPQKIATEKSLFEPEHSIEAVEEKQEQKVSSGLQMPAVQNNGVNEVESSTEVKPPIEAFKEEEVQQISSEVYISETRIGQEISLPNLRPYKPSGWDDKIVVSTVTGTNTEGDHFYVNQTLYLDWAWINDGDADAGIFRKSLYIDGVERKHSDGSLQAGYYGSVKDSEWTCTTTGWHTLKLLVDKNNDISESNEADNEYERQVYVEAEPEPEPDPLYPNQWHLNNTEQGGGTAGEDVNIESVWDTYRGSTNEIIAIVDDGLEVDHEDLAPNIIENLSHDYIDGDDDPSPTGNDNHGTAVAGVAAAHGWNELGVRGSAPEAGLLGYRLLGNRTVANTIDAWTRNMDQVDIYSNSWGSDKPYGEVLSQLTPEEEAAVIAGASTGRDGRGCIYVKSAGNGGNVGNSNYNEFGNMRYVIAVAASDNNGERSSYSHKGANIRVNAPSSGGTLDITTTDRSGSDGYSDGNYTDTFGGTSSVCPLVSGIIALMLQANPDLTWRDVQMILMTTAEKNDPTDSDWVSNGAGYHINHKYGFGRVDAQAAVNTALTWDALPSETFTEDSTVPNLTIPDNDNNGVTSEIQIDQVINVEFIEIYFTSSDHTFWGDLEIELESPHGTRSILAEQHDSAESTDTYNNWRFGSARHLGESSHGTWKLTVRDKAVYDIGTFQSWEIRIYGTLMSDTDGDGLIDDLENSICTDTYDADTDDDGISDGMEDSNHNGAIDAGETDPCSIDTDGDGIQDGTELGYTLANIGSDTNTNIFQPDLDPLTTTDPLNADTDGDGMKDGEEDTNHNGRVDQGETDPNPRKGMPWIPLLLLDD